MPICTGCNKHHDSQTMRTMPLCIACDDLEGEQINRCYCVVWVGRYGEHRSEVLPIPDGHNDKRRYSLSEARLALLSLVSRVYLDRWHLFGRDELVAVSGRGLVLARVNKVDYPEREYNDKFWRIRYTGGDE